MATAVDIGTLITRTPGRHGGRPCIGVAGPSVLAIVELFEMGVSPTSIKEDNFPHVPMEGIFAALAYWAANREEIDGYFREDQEAHDELFGPS